MKEKYKKCSVIPVVCMMIGIFYFSSQTAVVSAGLSGGITEKIFDFVINIGNVQLTITDRVFWFEWMETLIRKAAHMTEYAVFAVAMSYPFYVYSKRNGKIILWSMILCIFYAITDEIHQLFVVGRSGQITDVLIDGIGALIGCLIFAFFCSIIAKNQKRLNNNE